MFAVGELRSLLDGFAGVLFGVEFLQSNPLSDFRCVEQCVIKEFVISLYLASFMVFPLSFWLKNPKRSGSDDFGGSGFGVGIGSSRKNVLLNTHSVVQKYTSNCGGFGS